jgi:hypothetical protein
MTPERIAELRAKAANDHYENFYSERAAQLVEALDEIERLQVAPRELSKEERGMLLEGALLNHEPRQDDMSRYMLNKPPGATGPQMPGPPPRHTPLHNRNFGNGP